VSQVRSGEGELSDRQRRVLEAIVTAYVRQAVPIGSATISHVLPTKLSSASIRATLAELSEMGLVEQPHTSAGRVPTEEGLRFFIDELLNEQEVAEYDRRTIAFGMEEAEAAAVSRVAARLLSERTQQLGFVVAPTLDSIVLQHVSFVRLTTERVLAVLVSSTGVAYRRVLDDDGELDQARLDRIATLLNERVRGRNLRDVRDSLVREARALRREADRLLAKAIELGPCLPMETWEPTSSSRRAWRCSISPSSRIRAACAISSRRWRPRRDCWWCSIRYSQAAA
jgi:heat-inducible transcriptional repressor